MKNILYILSVILLVSCEKQVKNFELDDFEAEIVLNGLFQPDSVFKIHASKSIYGLWGDNLHPVNDLSIEVLKNGDPICTLDQQEGFYFFNDQFQPQLGSKYKIIANGDVSNTATCTFEIPEKAEFNLDEYSIISGWSYFGSYSWSEEEGEQYFQDSAYYNWLELSLTIHDKVETDNYYMISVIGPELQYIYDNEGYIVDSTVTYRKSHLKSNDNFIELYGSYDYVSSIIFDEEAFGTTLILSDKLFNGKSHTFMLNEIYVQQKIYTVLVYTITKDYFEFLTSLSKYTDDPFSTFFAEKTAVNTNVSNGLGMIGAMNTSKHELDLRNEELIDGSKK